MIISSTLYLVEWDWKKKMYGFKKINQQGEAVDVKKIN